MGVAGVVVDEHGRVLLVRRRQAGIEAGLWAFPGGHPHFGERLATAVAREVYEETGLEVSTGEALWVGDILDRAATPPWHYVMVNLRCQVIAGDLQPGDDAQEAAWFYTDEALGLALAQEVATVLRMLVSTGGG